MHTLGTMVPKTETDKFFQLRVNEQFTRDLDELRRLEPDLPSRAEMVRRLIDRALKPRKRQQRSH